MFENTYRAVSGILVIVCALEQVNIALQRNSLNKPEARYNRHGQDALYLIYGVIAPFCCKHLRTLHF